MPTTKSPRPTLTQQAAEAFLTMEAELLDERRLEEWLKLFTPDGLYWIPLDDTLPAEHSVSIVRDDAMRREERVFHLLHTRFPAQSPSSRTLHMVANVRVIEGGDAGSVTLRSNQVVHEVRVGDYRQLGLGERHTIVAKVEHVLRLEAGEPRIALKKVLLLDRDIPQGNLTFLL